MLVILVELATIEVVLSNYESRGKRSIDDVARQVVADKTVLNTSFSVTSALSSFSKALM